MLLDTTFDTKKVTVIWWNNSKHRVLTTLKRADTQRLLESIKPQDRFGYVNIDS